MATVSLRGKDKLYTHFTNVNESYWKLYNVADPKTPIQVCLSVKDVAKSKAFLVDIIDSLDPSGVYILDTYSKAEDKEVQKFMKPSTSLCFSLSEGVDPIEDKPAKGTNIYSTAPASLKDQIDLIKENAKLSMEVSLYKSRYEDQLIEISKLKLEIEELEEELEEMEEEEEDAAAVGGVAPPKDIMESIARLITEHGGTVVENLMSKGIKEKIDFSTEEEKIKEDESEKKVSGITEMPAIDAIVKELYTRDNNFHKHMYKLLLIAREKPLTFKAFLLKLETF